MAFKTALVVVDMQNDFCLSDGALAVEGAMDIVPLINKLLSLPTFGVKVATKDWHPEEHVSFAANHPHPDNKPFESFVELSNIVAGKPDDKMQQRLWPIHCVQESKGAELIADLDSSSLDLIVEKGMDKRVEMYSGFHDSFGNNAYTAGGVSHDLAQELRDRDVTHVYVTGVAGDYCVNHTALGAAKAGFTTYLIEDAQKCVDPTSWSEVKRELDAASVKVISSSSDEVVSLLPLE